MNDRLAQALDIAADCNRVTHIMSLIEVEGQAIGIRDSHLSPSIATSVLDYLDSSPDLAAPLVLPADLRLSDAQAEIEVSSASPF